MIAIVMCGIGLTSCGERSKIREQLSAALKEDAGYSERLLKSEEESPDASIVEFDAFCDRSIELRTERLIKVRALPLQDPIRQDLSEYFDAENSLTRTKRRFCDQYVRLAEVRAEYVSNQSHVEAAKTKAKRYRRDGGRTDVVQRLEMAVAWINREEGYLRQQLSLIGLVNESAQAALSAEADFVQALKSAAAAENIAARRLTEIGIQAETPVNRLKGGIAARLSRATDLIDAQVIK